MARVPNTPRVQAQAIKENKKRALTGVKKAATTKGAMTVSSMGTQKRAAVAGSKEMRGKLSYKTAVAATRAESAGISPKKVARVAEKAENKAYSKASTRLVKASKKGMV
jgi:hypothetical protein